MLLPTSHPFYLWRIALYGRHHRRYDHLRGEQCHDLPRCRYSHTNIILPDRGSVTRFFSNILSLIEPDHACLSRLVLNQWVTPLINRTYRPWLSGENGFANNFVFAEIFAKKCFSADLTKNLRENSALFVSVQNWTLHWITQIKTKKMLPLNIYVKLGLMCFYFWF